MYIAGLVCGIVGVVFSFIMGASWVGLILGVIALTFGIIGLVKKEGGGKAIAATALGGVSVVISIIVTIIAINVLNTAANIFTSGLNEASDIINNAVENYNNTSNSILDYDDDVLGTKVSVTLGAYQDAQDDTWSDKALPVTVTNISNETSSFSISVEALDANGDRIDEDTIYARDLAPGQSYTEETFDWSSVDEEVLEKATFRVYRANAY